MLGTTSGCGAGRLNPGGKRGGTPLIWSLSFIGRLSKTTELSDFFCCCCVCDLLRPGGGLFPISPFSSSSTVQAFFKDGKDDRDWVFEDIKFKGLLHTPGRGTIPSLSNTKWDKLSSISTVEISYKKYKNVRKKERNIFLTILCKSLLNILEVTNFSVKSHMTLPLLAIH